MALRFRKSMKIAPGVRLNLGKKSTSVRVGPKGAGYTVGTSGQRVSAGLPGSGLHYTEKVAGTPSASGGVFTIIFLIVAASLAAFFWL
jgi:hypothetical protein